MTPLRFFSFEDFRIGIFCQVDFRREVNFSVSVPGNCSMSFSSFLRYSARVMFVFPMSTAIMFMVYDSAFFSFFQSFSVSSLIPCPVTAEIGIIRFFSFFANCFVILPSGSRSILFAMTNSGFLASSLL